MKKLLYLCGGFLKKVTAMNEHELTPYEMQLKLNTIGYDMEYLETLQDSQIQKLFEEEFF